MEHQYAALKLNILIIRRCMKTQMCLIERAGNLFVFCGPPFKFCSILRSSYHISLELCHVSLVEGVTWISPLRFLIKVAYHLTIDLF